MARTVDGKLYCWGSNWSGFLGNGRSGEILNKPEVNEYLIDKHIIQMSCGAQHSLVLTNEGEVYGWGNNYWGQIGNRNIGYGENQLIPYLVNEFNGEKVISISCGYDHSLALTDNGSVNSWGRNECGQLGRNTGEETKSNIPKAIELNEDIIIEKICCGFFHSLLLSREGDIYWFGSYDIYGERREQLFPIKVDKSIKFKDIAAHFDYYFCCALSTNDVYYVFGYISDEEIIEEPKETEFKSFNEMFLFHKGITYNSIVGKLSEFNDYFIRQGFYEKEFFDRKEIGGGSYGTVFEVKQLNYNKEETRFAIKRMELNFSEQKNIPKELENYSVIKQLRNKKLVETYDLWFENEITNNINVVAQKPLKRYVYIKMELCDKTLKELIEEIKNDVQLIHDNCLTLLGYYTCCNIFIQILEGVNYLHTRKPPIIHRDLTPYNILIKLSNKTNSIVKIADLGLTCLHNYKGQQHTDDRGNTNYTAPEALISTNYDTRADIFSLGVILQKLFQTDINRDYTENDKSSLMKKYQTLSELCDKMIQPRVNQRPQSCQQILNHKNLWALMDNELNINKEFKEYSDKCDEQYKKSYVYKVIELMTKNLKSNLIYDSGEISGTSENSDFSGDTDSCPITSPSSYDIFLSKNSKKNSYNFYKKLNQCFENNIKLSFVSDLNIIIITKEGKVYEFSRNAINNSLLIFSNNKSIIEKKINESLVSELCDKGIIDFKNSNCHTIARTSDGKIYCWGSNRWGVLGNGSVDSSKVHRPKLNEHLKRNFIIDMSCGFGHSLVLTNDGKMYAWGWNCDGQVGNRKSGKDECQTTPYFVNEFNGEKIKSISCGLNFSYALTQSGRVYSWGNNNWGQLCRNTGEEYHSNCPKLIELYGEIVIEKICCSLYQNLLLSRKGEIYFIKSDYAKKVLNDKETSHQLILTKLYSTQKFKEIASHWNIYFSCALSINGLYYIWGKISEEEVIREPKETQFKSFNEIFMYYLGITYNTIEAKFIEFNDNLVRNGFFENEFLNHELIVEGGYGKVFKVKKLNDLKQVERFAINRIELRLDYDDEFILQGMENYSLIKELNNEKVIKYYDLWLQNMKNSQNLFVFIQMELCNKTLNGLMKKMKKDVKVIENNSLTLLGYYISCKLFIQILEGVRYLHTRNPIIIHRNLNPYNILIKLNEMNNSVVKIAGLGFICLHKYENQKHTEDVGNKGYAAPEVVNSIDYDTRADIYSLGVIFKQLFLIDSYRDIKVKNEKYLLMNEYYYLRKLCDQMTEVEVEDRLESCLQVMIKLKSLAFKVKELDINKEFQNFCDCDEEYKNDYIFKLIKLFTDNPYESILFKSDSESNNSSVLLNEVSKRIEKTIEIHRNFF